MGVEHGVDLYCWNVVQVEIYSIMEFFEETLGHRFINS